MTGGGAPASIYDRQAGEYDGWYDTPKGQAIFDEELSALQPLVCGQLLPRLEVGVGSGRFAAALGVEVGIDPASGALRLAAQRGIRVVEAKGEQLPFRARTFGVVLFMVTLCFVQDPLAALREAGRVLKPGGRLVIGDLPADGPWGRHYRAQAEAGHPYYREAHFVTRAELTSLLAAAGFTVSRARSALRWRPDARPVAATALEGDDRWAGFVAVAAAASNE